MSVYKRPGADAYSYDFQVGGLRFSGPTGCAERREALRYEREVARPAAARQLALKARAVATFQGEAALTFRIACARYVEEHAAHLKAADDIIHCLGIACDHFGLDRTLDSVTDSDVAAFVARLRGRRRGDREGDVPRLSNRRVNAIGVERLSALFGYARRRWKIRFPAEPDWRIHTLPEPKPEPREIPVSRSRAAIEDLAEGYREAIAFALATGLRLAELDLRWSQIDWQARVVILVQKGGRERRLVLSAVALAILAAQRGKHPTHVFTYVCRRRGGKLGPKRKLGERYPVTSSGLKSAWRHMRGRQGFADRIHDTRHTRAMTLLRSSGNLKAVQQQLGHARIETTARTYAHVIDDDQRRLLDAADAASPTESPTAQEDEKRKA
jgi:integrase